MKNYTWRIWKILGYEGLNFWLIHFLKLFSKDWYCSHFCMWNCRIARSLKMIQDFYWFLEHTTTLVQDLGTGRTSVCRDLGFPLLRIVSCWWVWYFEERILKLPELFIWFMYDMVHRSHVFTQGFGAVKCKFN